MRLISLLIGLILVAYLVSTQLSPDSTSGDINTNIDQQDVPPPKVPVAPSELKEFEADMNTFIQDTASERNKKLKALEDSSNK
jgi:hypothetical protein